MGGLAELALSGNPLGGITVIDAHMHSTRTSHFFSRFENGPDLLAQMDRIGVDSGILSDLWSFDSQWGTFDKLSKFCQGAPGRFFAYSSPHPDWEDFDAALSEQCRSPLVVGIKLHPVLHNKPFDCKQYLHACETGADHGLPLLFHTWGAADIEAITRLARQFQNTVFLIGHSGGEADAVKLAARRAAEYSNLYLDSACSFVWQGAIEYMASVAGAEKILYGSDAYWNSMEVAAGRILFADLPDEKKRLILGENALRVFTRISVSGR